MLKVYLVNTSMFNESIINTLTSDDIAKANRFKLEDDKIRSLLSSYLLKYVLKDNCVKNTNIHFNEFGKPFLESGELYFNLSHSGSYVVCVVSKQEVGVDIEQIRKSNELVVKKCFTNEEKVFVKDDSTFTKVWTLKESYIKNIGTGLKTKLDTFSVINNGNIAKVNDLMFTSMCLDNYHLSICHLPSKDFKMIYLNHSL